LEEIVPESDKAEILCRLNEGEAALLHVLGGISDGQWSSAWSI
jgi:hypothetical protein